MSKLQELKDYMGQVKLKKVVFGGYSKEDVQAKMDMIYAMFEKAMKDREAKEEALTAQFEERINKLTEEFENKKRLQDVLIVDLNKNISELTEEKMQMEEAQLEMKNSYKTYCENMLSEYKVSLRTLSGEFSRILENVSNIQKMIDEENIFEGLEHAFIEKSQEAIAMSEEVVELEENTEEENTVS